MIQEKDIFLNPLPNYHNEPYELFLVNNKIYLFSVFTHAKEGTTTLGLFIYNDNFENQSFEIIDSIENLSQTNIIIELSDEKDAILVSKNHPHKLTHREVVNLNCIDLYGKSIWKKELMSLNDVHKVNVEKTVFLNKNEIYLLCNYGFNNNKNANLDDIKLLSNKYTIWIYNHQLNFLKEIDLKLKLKWLNGLDIRVKPNKNILVTGFVNSTRTFAINAFFNIEIDRKYEITQNNYVKIPEIDLRLFLPKASKKKLLENFFLRDISVQSDGSFYVIGEHFYKYLDRVYDPRTNTTSTTEHFNYEYILCAYFDQKGQIKWIKRIPKIQNSTNDYGYHSSFTSFNTKNGVYLIYNDFEKNVDLPIEDTENLKEIFNGRKNALTYVKLGPDGPVFRKHILSGSNYLLYAKKSTQIGLNNMYLLLELGRKAKIISVSF